MLPKVGKLSLGRTSGAVSSIFNEQPIASVVESATTGKRIVSPKLWVNKRRMEEKDGGEVRERNGSRSVVKREKRNHARPPERITPFKG